MRQSIDLFFSLAKEKSFKTKNKGKVLPPYQSKLNAKNFLQFQDTDSKYSSIFYKARTSKNKMPEYAKEKN